MKGSLFGDYRVIKPVGALPQPAEILNNDMSILYDNEIRVNVETLNVDSASFTQIKNQANGDLKKIEEIILSIVNKTGKLKNPVTGSGGMFIGEVDKIGKDLKERPLKKGDKIASLVSLSLTPLKIDKIIKVKPDIDQVDIKGQAILFESGIYSPLPSDIAPTLALAVLDVCGAPAQTARLVKSGDIVVIIGASGKSGILCAYTSKRKVGHKGMVIGVASSDKGLKRLYDLNICDINTRFDATDALSAFKEIEKLTDGKLADVVINCVNVPNTEMASILVCKERGTLYFFSMVTSFTKAALGAEGVGKDINMIIGNGYAQGHADISLNIIRESRKIRILYEKLYC